MTKAEREYVDMTAELTATRVVNNTLGGTIKIVQEHEAILNNGLKQAVKRLNESLDGHIKAHDKYDEGKKKGRRYFWTVLGTGVIIGIVSGAGSLLLSHIL